MQASPLQMLHGFNWAVAVSDEIAEDIMLEFAEDIMVAEEISC